MIPMIVPIVSFSSDDEPTKCPKCEKLENIARVCQHCGYKYIEDEWSPTFGGFIKGFVVTTVVIWSLWTLGFWVFHNPAYRDYDSSKGGYIYHKESLKEILSNQWDTVKNQCERFRGLRL